MIDRKTRPFPVLRANTVRLVRRETGALCIVCTFVLLRKNPYFSVYPGRFSPVRLSKKVWEILEKTLEACRFYLVFALFYSREKRI